MEFENHDRYVLWLDVVWLVKMLILSGLISTMIPKFTYHVFEYNNKMYAYKIDRVAGTTKLVHLDNGYTVNY